MASSESLFDNSVISESKPSTADDLDLGKTLITYRILVSRREAGAIIGKNGGNISKIREEYEIKAGVSKIVEGCIDRILSVTGMVDNVPKAIVEIAKSVTDANVDTVREAEERNSDPTRLITYDFFPLKPLSPRPNFKDPEYAENLFLRLLIPNSQVGTLIGKGGARIKSIQDDFGVKMVASKGFLENSTERLVELQGTEDKLKEALFAISKYLLRDYQGTAPITFYLPCAVMESGRNNYRGNSNDTRNNGGKEIIRKITFPGDYIGALIGKRGARIQEIRRVSHCAIAVDSEDGEDDEREITLIGTRQSVEKAIDLLNMYYEREQQRRNGED